MLSYSFRLHYPHPCSKASLAASEDSSCSAYVAARWTRFKYYSAHAWRECVKRKFQYCLGFSSILIVVIVAAVCFTMVSKAPAIFLQQAEGSGGQIDMLVTPGSASGAAYLNYPAFAALTAPYDVSAYSAPRLRLGAVAFGPPCTAAVAALGITAGLVNVSEPAPWMYTGDPLLPGTP